MTSALRLLLIVALVAGLGACYMPRFECTILDVNPPPASTVCEARP